MEQSAIESTAQTPTPTPTPIRAQPQHVSVGSEIGLNANYDDRTNSTSIALDTSTSIVTQAQHEDTSESQETTEHRDQENANNEENADNNDIINVYSSGDEGKFYLITFSCSLFLHLEHSSYRWCRECK